MQSARITLKNYRCFGDTQPASVDVANGFTALVGPNNSGKSSFLKFIYEYQGLWNLCTNVGVLAGWVSNEKALQGINVRSVTDISTIISDQTGRPLSITLEFPGPSNAPSQPRLSKVVFTTPPGAPQNFGAQLYHGFPPQRITEQAGSMPVVQYSGGIHKQVDCSPLIDLADALRDSMYIGPFRNAINQGAGTYYDVTIGTSFVATWNQWKAGESRSQHNVILAVTDDISRVFGYRRLEINASADGNSLLTVIDGQSYRLQDIGAGVAQFIILFGNVAIRRPSLLLIDEPELNLHPSLQVDFLTSLVSYTSLQSVIFATHSIGLARTTADRVFAFQRQADQCVVKPFEQTAQFAEFLGEMSFATFRELGHDTVLLVEGATELRAVQQFLRLLKKDHQVVLIHLGGSAMIRGGVEPELSELTRLSHNIAVLIDSERVSADASLAPEREAFLESCRSLGIRAHATERRAFENYLTEPAIQALKGPKYKALAAFERLSHVAMRWGKDENWRIARAMTLSELMATDVGKFLDSL